MTQQNNHIQARSGITTFLRKSLAGYHRKAYQMYGDVLPACVKSQALTLTHIARNLSGYEKDKHAIKRVDRFLSSPIISGSKYPIYKYIASKVIAKNSEPIILVDGVHVGSYDSYFISGSVSIRNRSQCVFALEFKGAGAEMVSKNRQEFLDGLASILPEGCRPILVTDAGFRFSWTELVLKMGWDFITRCRGLTKVARPHGYLRMDDLSKTSTSKNQCLGKCRVRKIDPLNYRLILSKTHYPTGRSQKNKNGNKKKSGAAKRYAKVQTEAWVLGSSRQDYSADKIVSIYKTRMHIEEMFRDQKSHRLGLGLHQSMSYKLGRLEILYLLSSIVLFFCLCNGLKAEQLDLQSYLQANTSTEKLFSTFRLGLNILRRGWPPSEIIEGLELVDYTKEIKA